VTRSPLQQHLLSTYGTRLTVKEIAQALRVSPTKVYQGIEGLKTYVEGRTRWADYRDVARYLDAQRAKEEA
jgi:hypothetical protein